MAYHFNLGLKNSASIICTEVFIPSENEKKRSKYSKKKSTVIKSIFLQEKLHE